MDGAGEMRRGVDFLAGLLHQNSRGVDARGGMAFRFENDRAKPARRGGLGAQKTRETCPDNGEIEIFHTVPQEILAGRFSGVTLRSVTWLRRLRSTSKRKP